MTLSETQISAYHRDGFIVLENQVPMHFIKQIRREISDIHERARSMTDSDERIDIEPGHSEKKPRVRRVKLPHLHVPACRKLMSDSSILDPVKDLLGPDLRLHTSKLNMKSAGYGSPVEWHQDWAFYPHTNDDLLAVGVMIDDMEEDNGPLLMLPGSHRGRIYNHHSGGRFTGAIDPAEIDTSTAVKVIAPAGAISLHHVRLVHGSDTNRSEKNRRLLLYEISCADAFPIMGALSKLPSIEEYDGRLLSGTGTLEPRLVNVPVRIPLPAPENFGSIYALQSGSKRRAFEVVKEDAKRRN